VMPHVLVPIRVANYFSGAHTDFGSVTLLLQGEIDGLQVYEKTTDEWLDVCFVPQARSPLSNLS
jgi:isopenicillin N synthase-like dioxygenase